MKRCPTCQQTFDDSQSFCANDGTRLINEEEEAAPDFDPMATIMSPPPPRTGDIKPPPSQNFTDQQHYTDQPPPAASSWMDPPAQTPLTPSPSWPGGGMQPQNIPSYANMPNQQNTLAIVSLVCGILSLICLGIITGVPAIITGFMQLNKIKTDPATYGGRGMAIGGMVTGSIGTLFSILGILMLLLGIIGGSR